MSVYPVKIKEWYYNKESPFYKERKFLEKILLPNLTCNECGKKATKSGYVMHAITYGYATEDYWCSIKCLEK